MSTEPTTVGSRLRSRRVELGLTLAQVAEKSQLSVPYVSNLERGRGNPTLDALQALAGALGIPVSAIVGEGSSGDPMSLALANAPASLVQFSRSETFKAAIQTLAEQQGETIDHMRQRVLVGMASAPRRSKGEPTEDDWRRLLDAYSLILQR